MGLKHRKNNRLAWYDYSQDGFYFVTMVVKDRLESLGASAGEKIELTIPGKTALETMNQIPAHYCAVNLDEFVIMPNHVHAIIAFNRYSEAKPGDEFIVGQNEKYGLLSKIIKSFKHIVTKTLKESGLKPVIWQRSFYDHVIRDEKEYLRIKEYIINNPLKWELDAENSKVSGDAEKYYKKIIEGE